MSQDPPSTRAHHAATRYIYAWGGGRDTGVDRIAISAVSITGDHTTATATSVDWADYVVPNPDGTPFHFHPNGTTEYAFSLERSSDGTSRIDGETWQFGPGSDP